MGGVEQDAFHLFQSVPVAVDEGVIEDDEGRASGIAVATETDAFVASGKPLLVLASGLIGANADAVERVFNELDDSVGRG